MADTTLDLSKPKDAHIAQRLRENLMIWITSVRPDGRPHSVPVWFLWDAASNTILILSKPDQKIRNLRANPQVIVAVDDTRGGEDVVLLEGEAALVDRAAIEALLPAYDAKYDEKFKQFNWTVESMLQSYNQPISIKPTRFMFR